MPVCYRCHTPLVNGICPKNCEPRRKVAGMVEDRPLAMVDPELERLLAEEEEIERKVAYRKASQQTLRLTELDFLRLIADCKDDSLRNRMRGFYNDNSTDIIGIGVNFKVVC